MSEEINIGSSPQQPSEPLVRNDQHSPQLDEFLSPTSSNEELLDAILHLAPDQLIKWEECALPSGGMYYGWPDGVCMVKPMGQTAEKILSTSRLVSSGQAIEYLFRECCKFPDGFDSTELLLGDRVFLLYFLRGITHGNMYEFAVACPSCQTINTHTYDLNELASTIKPHQESLGHEPFRVSLPYMSELTGRDFWVSIRFLRAYDVNDLLSRKKIRDKTFTQSSVRTRRSKSADPRQQQNQNVVLNNTLDDNLEKVIVNIMGVEDRLKIRQFIQRMHAQDAATIREWLREFTPGIDTMVEITCPECEHEFAVELPITENFFRPTKK